MRTALVIGNHPIVRRGLASLLRETGLGVVLEAGTAEEAKLLLGTEGWTVALVCVQLPDTDSLFLVSELRKQGCTGPVLAYGAVPDKFIAARALRSGCNGYIHKLSSLTVLREAINRVSQGLTYISPEFAEDLAASQVLGIPLLKHETLSVMEYRVMMLISQGMTPITIAQHLVCSTGSISTYRARVLAKLGLKTSADIIHYVLLHHLAPPAGGHPH